MELPTWAPPSKCCTVIRSSTTICRRSITTICAVAALPCAPERSIRIVGELARATGTVNGMIGGQVMDLEAEHKQSDATELETIHRSKTGALITAALVTGGIYGGADDAAVERIRS